MKELSPVFPMKICDNITIDVSPQRGCHEAYPELNNYVLRQF